MNVFEHIKRLYEHQLYSNVVQIIDTILPGSLLERGNTLPAVQRYLTLVFHGHSLLNLSEYQRAEVQLKRALLFRKSLIKARARPVSTPCSSSTAVAAEIDDVSEADIRFWLYQSLLSQRHHSQAIAALEGIPAKQRSSRVNMALGRLYQQAGTERAAVTAYKEVLHECPLALESARQLVVLGVKSQEVVGLIMNGANATVHLDWLPSWLRVHSLLASGEYDACCLALRQSDGRTTHSTTTTAASATAAATAAAPSNTAPSTLSLTFIADGAQMQNLLGRALYCAGDFAAALPVLQRARAAEPLATDGSDLLAALYYGEKRGSELAQLAQTAARLCGGGGGCATEQHHEPWMVLGYHALLSRRARRALHFAHKAAALRPRDADALSLKGTLLLRLKKPEDAAVHFREAMQSAPSRFEPLQGLVECYCASGRLKEALALVNSASRQMGYTARALTLCACVMLREPLYASRAYSCLERALSRDPHHLPAALLLADVYEKSALYESAVEVLQRQLHVHACSARLHLRLAELLTLSNRDGGGGGGLQGQRSALQHCQTALSLSPACARTATLLRRLDADPASTALEVDVEEDLLTTPTAAEDSETDATTMVDDVEDSDCDISVPGWSQLDLSFDLS